MNCSGTNSKGRASGIMLDSSPCYVNNLSYPEYLSGTNGPVSPIAAELLAFFGEGKADTTTIFEPLGGVLRKEISAGQRQPFLSAIPLKGVDCYACEIQPSFCQDTLFNLHSHVTEPAGCSIQYRSA